MEITWLSNSIIEFLLLTSALVFILGVLSSLVLRVLKIQGKPKLWIYTLLVIMPLAYPIQAFFPDPIRVPIPLKTFQLLDFHLSETTAGGEAVSNVVSFLTATAATTYQSEGTETEFTGREAFGGNAAIGSVETASEFPVNWKLMAALAWFLFFFYSLVRLVIMVYNTNRFSKLPEPVTNPQVVELLHKCAVDTGVRRTPLLLTLDRLPSAMVMGVFKPRILLPKHLLKPEFREGLRFTLLHELKHVHQHHNWWLLIESIICAAYFFHPVILWTKRRLHEEREYICDSHVVHITNKSIAYADFLLHEIWQQKHERKLVLSLPFISGMTKTTNRVRSILENARPTLFAQVRGKIALCLISLSFVSLLLCNVAPSAQDLEQTPHTLTPAMTDTRDSVSFLAWTAQMEKEDQTLLKRGETFYEDGTSFGLSAEHASLDNAELVLQTGASSVRADEKKADALTTLREEPKYAPVLERKRPAILMDETGIRAIKTSARQPIPDANQSVPRPVLNIDAPDDIVLAQNESSMTVSSDAAMVSERKTIERNHENASFYMQQGAAHYKQNRFGKAIADYSKAIEIDDRLAVAYNNRGSAYYRQGRFDKAISDFSKAITLDPVNADTYYTRGFAYYKTGLFDSAISDFNKAIVLNPEYITKMPEGVTPAREREDIDYSSQVEESLKWHHGSLPPHYWDMVKVQNTDSKTVTPYQIKKRVYR